jgi:hypothetical protein
MAAIRKKWVEGIDLEGFKMFLSSLNWVRFSDKINGLPD